MWKTDVDDDGRLNVAAGHGIDEDDSGTESGHRIGAVVGAAFVVPRQIAGPTTAEASDNIRPTPHRCCWYDYCY